MICQTCKQHEREWIWQPERESFYLPGSHIRGFQAIGVCELCREKIVAGETMQYRYKGQDYTANGE